MDLPLSGHGLVLRMWREDDLPTMVDLFDDPDIAYRTPLASPFDLAAAYAYMERAHRLYVEGQRIQLAITEDGQDRPLGEVLFNRAGRTIGYGIGAAHRGRRLAVRAVQVMTDYAHRRLGLPHVYLEIEPDNGPSGGVARAAGYRLTDAPPGQVIDKGRAYTLLTWVHDAPADR
jgi:RimJ/RimL family protein N-acetyltransferase